MPKTNFNEPCPSDVEFKTTVLKYIEQDKIDNAEFKALLTKVQETQTTQRVDIAVLQTKAGFVGAISGVIFGSVSAWIVSLFGGTHK